MGTRPRKGVLHERIGMLFLGLILGIVSCASVSHRGQSLSTSQEATDEQFKYGSIGTETAQGIPYWIWQVLPQVCAEELPGGYESLGIVREEGHDLPLGFVKGTIHPSSENLCSSFDLPVVDLPFIEFPIADISTVSINCALCHTATFRTAVDTPRHIVPGGSAHQFDAQGYLNFLFACADKPTFSADAILSAIEQRTVLSFREKLLYRLLVTITRCKLREQKELFSFARKQPLWGPGRLDAINPIKIGLLNFPPDESIGTADMPAVWQLNPAHARHWDGNNMSLTEAIRGEALATGTIKEQLSHVDKAALMPIKSYLQHRSPPQFRQHFPLDLQLAEQGKTLFTQHCAACHASEKDGKETWLGTVIPLKEIGTDPYRLQTWTLHAANANNAISEGYDWQFFGFQKAHGYVAVPLDGIWLRAPYLHNGSVPTLADLLEPPERRPTLFYRGYDVYDGQKGGFISDVAEEHGRKFFSFDTRHIGNSNSGHLFGTDLSPDDKRALLEYLKTL